MGDQRADVQASAGQQPAPTPAQVVTPAPAPVRVLPAIATDDVAARLRTVAIQINDGPPEIVEADFGPATPLATLRAELVKRGAIDRNDRFYVNGAVVTASAEALTFVSATMEGDDGVIRLHRKTDDRDIVTALLPESHKGVSIADFAEHADKISGDLQRGTKAIETKNEDNYVTTLPDAKRAQVLELNNVFKGVALKDGEVAWSFRRAVDTGSAAPSCVYSRIPQQSYYSNEHFTFDKTEHEVRSTIAGSLSGSYSGVGMGISAELSGSSADAAKTSKTTIFGYCDITVPKVEVRIYESVKLVRDCKAALEGFAGRTGQSFGDFEALRSFFETWGAYLPMEYVIGGKLYSSDEKKLEAKDDASKWAVEFKAAFSTLASDMKASASKTGDTSSASDKQARRALLQAVGGDVGRVAVPPEWVASLGDYRRWRPCRVSGLKPFYEFASRKAQYSIFVTLWSWQQLWRSDPVMMNFDDYLFPLARRFAQFRLS